MVARRSSRRLGFALLTAALATTAAPVSAHADTTAAATPIPVTRIAGSDRIATSIAVSQQRFPQPLPVNGPYQASAVLARSDDYADALAGAPLANQYGPLLLTPGQRLDDRVATELRRVLPAGGTVYLLGTSDVMSVAVETALTGMSYTVVRLGGADRYATAAKIAERLLSINVDETSCSYVLATGRDFPDAVVAAGLTSIDQPLLYTDGATLPAATLAEINRCATARSSNPGMGATNTDVIAVGGPAAAAVTGPVTGVRGLFRVTQSAVGTDRYETSTAAGPRYSPYTTTPPISVATGTDYADALLSATLGDRYSTVQTVLVRPNALPTPVRDFLVANRAAQGQRWGQAYVVGGPNAVSDDVLRQVDAAVN